MTKKVGKIEIVHGTQILQRVIVIVQSTEAVTRGVQKKMLFLNILQYPQENTIVGVSY